MTGVRTGRCLRGAVRYALRGPLDGAIGCHCGQCRRTSGHYTAGALIRRDGVTITEDRGLAWRQSSPEARHVFVGDKGDYYEITDGTPQHHAYDRPLAPPSG